MPLFHFLTILSAAAIGQASPGLVAECCVLVDEKSFRPKSGYHDSGDQAWMISQPVVDTGGRCESR